mgnify:FL=1
MIVLKDKHGLIEELANTMMDRASVDKLKEVYRDSVIKEFTGAAYMPDYLLLEVCERYNMDISKFTETKDETD